MAPSGQPTSFCTCVYHVTNALIYPIVPLANSLIPHAVEFSDNGPKYFLWLGNPLFPCCSALHVPFNICALQGPLGERFYLQMISMCL